MAATTLEELQVLITAETKGLRRELDSVKTQLKGTSAAVSKTTTGIGATLKKVGVAIAGALAVRKVVQFGVSAVQAASQVETALLGLQSILEGQGRSFGQANQFVQEYVSDGLVPLREAVTAYKNLAARGYNDEQIRNVMERLKDAAAFGRQSSQSLGEAVQSATEGLKNENSVLVDNAGVTKNVAKMWEEYAKSIGKSASELSQQEKIQAEVNGIMQETKFQVGDAARYADTYAGRLSRLSKTLQDIKVNIGQAFMPIANVVLPLLQSMANAVARVTAFISQFMQALFGSNAAAAKSSQRVAEAQLGVADATTKAGQAAKGSVAGFDEINQLAEKSDEGGAAGTGAIPGLAEVGSESDAGSTGGALTTISENARRMAERVKSAFDSVKEVITSTKDVVLPALGAIGTALATAFLVSKLLPFITYVQYIGALSGTSGLAALGATLSHLASVAIAGVTAKIQALWALLMAHPVLVVVAAIGALIGALAAAYRTNEGFRAAVDNLVASLKTALAPAIEFIQNVLTGVWNGVFVPFGDFLVWLWQMVIVPVAGVLTDVLGVAFGVLASAASSLWNNVLVPFGDFLLTVFGGIIQGLADIFSHWWQNVLVPIGSFLADVFGPIVEDISSAFTFLWKQVMLPLIEFLVGTFKGQFESVTKTIGGIIDGLKTTFTGLIDFITGVFTGDWEKAWKGVREIFKGIFDTLWSVVKYPLNLIIDGVNLLIRGLNRVNFDIPDWVPLIGGRSFGINIPQIPKLARGGIIDQPTVAMLGERGREAVVPLENSGFIASLANAVASAVGTALLQVQQLNGSGGTSLEGMELAIYMDSTKVARATIPAIDKERARKGVRGVIQPVGGV